MSKGRWSKGAGKTDFWYMCTYIYICVCVIHACMYIYILVVCVHIYAYIYVYIYIYTYVYIYVYKYTHIYIYIHIHSIRATHTHTNCIILPPWVVLASLSAVGKRPHPPSIGQDHGRQGRAISLVSRGAVTVREVEGLYTLEMHNESRQGAMSGSSMNSVTAAQA